MPILFVVKRSRPTLYRSLKRLERPGLVAVFLERRRGQRRRRRAVIAFTDRRSVSLRQPLDADGEKTWRRLGFVVVKVHALPDGSARRSTARPALRSRTR
jgi:DNA-binding PadR family transcriptional regulator